MKKIFIQFLIHGLMMGGLSLPCFAKKDQGSGITLYPEPPQVNCRLLLAPEKGRPNLHLFQEELSRLSQSRGYHHFNLSLSKMNPELQDIVRRQIHESLLAIPNSELFVADFHPVLTTSLEVFLRQTLESWGIPMSRSFGVRYGAAFEKLANRVSQEGRSPIFYFKNFEPDAPGMGGSQFSKMFKAISTRLVFAYEEQSPPVFMIIDSSLPFVNWGHGIEMDFPNFYLQLEGISEEEMTRIGLQP